MTGSHNQWSGKLDCFDFDGPNIQEEHSFTAISRRVDGQAHIAER